MRHPTDKVNFVVSCLEHEAVELKLRLRYDNLAQSAFFRSLMRLYIQNDPTMMVLVERVKSSQKSMGKKKIYKSKKEIEKGNDILEQLGISDSDKEDIFDIIEEIKHKYE